MQKQHRLAVALVEVVHAQAVLLEVARHDVEQDGLRMHYLDEGEGDPVLCSTASRRGRTSTVR